jgi:hypothetical protein
MILDANTPASFNGRRATLRALDAREGAVSPAARPGRSFGEVADEIEAERLAKFGGGDKETKPASAKAFSPWQSGDFGFGDFLDIINPLHHVPIVATIYRNMSGDTLGMAPRVIGGALWGRIGGFVAGVVNAFVEWFTGKDIGDHVYAFFFGDSSSASPTGALASNGSGEKSQTTDSASDTKNPRVYPTSLPRAPRENGLRPETSRDRIDDSSSAPEDFKDLTWPNLLHSSRYRRSKGTGREAERQTRVRRTA